MSESNLSWLDEGDFPGVDVKELTENLAQQSSFGMHLVSLL